MSCNYTVLLALSHVRASCQRFKTDFCVQFVLTTIKACNQKFTLKVPNQYVRWSSILQQTNKNVYLKRNFLTVFVAGQYPIFAESNERRYSLIRVCISFSILRCIIKLCIVTLRLCKSFESLFSCGWAHECLRMDISDFLQNLSDDISLLWSFSLSEGMCSIRCTFASLSGLT